MKKLVKSLFSENVKPENYRFYKITQIATLLGLSGHFFWVLFSSWYGVYKKSTRELTYASGGHPPALLIGDTDFDDSRATPLRTPNNVIGAVPDAAYQKNKHRVGEQRNLIRQLS